MGAAGADGGGRGALARSRPWCPLPHAHTTGRWYVDRRCIHLARFPARLLPQVSRLLAIFSAVGARAIPQACPSTDAMTAVGVVGALELEIRALAGKRLPAHSEQRLSNGLVVAISGVGRDRAYDAGQRLIDAGAIALVSWGSAASL